LSFERNRNRSSDGYELAGFRAGLARG
jgi:hypothetical protein